MDAAELMADDAPLSALQVPFERGDLIWPHAKRVLFMGARAGNTWFARAGAKVVCQQHFKPFADTLQQHGLEVALAAPDARFDLVMALPPRQREARRAMFARALDHVAEGGVLVVAVSNRDGARSAQDDLARLAGPVTHLSKHKCRVFWTQPEPGVIDTGVRGEWRTFDALRPTLHGMISRPGLFAWDRIDPASALLAEHLPADLSGRVADLGAGTGYLAMQVARRCPKVTHITLYEADARALPAARANMEAALRRLARPPKVAVRWHDVLVGLPERFDAIVSNPPFHQGHADQPELGRGFIVAAANALRTGDRLLIVANRHLAYEATLRERFAGARVIVERDGFKVIGRGVEARRLSRPAGIWHAP
jgi:16S rRNA (guanine1207-N2)-methyltransferase